MRAFGAGLLLWVMTVAGADAQATVKLYENAKETAAAAFPDADRLGSELQARMAELERALEREKDPLLSSPGRPVILAVRAAAELQRERPEAAPNPKDVTARCLAMVDKTYGALNASSTFARAFWEQVAEVRAKLPEFDSTGAWPLAAGALAELKLAGSPGKSGGRNGGDFGEHRAWLEVGGGAEWPPKTTNHRAKAVTITQTGTDTWQSSDGSTITRTASGKYEVSR